MGNYHDLTKAKAMKLVVNKKSMIFSKFVDKKMGYWLREGDKNLHYGRGYLEGKLKLNRLGLAYYNKVFKK